MMLYYFDFNWFYSALDYSLGVLGFYDLYFILFLVISLFLLYLLILSSTIFLGLLVLLCVLMYVLYQHLFLGIYDDAVWLFFLFITMNFIFVNKLYIWIKRLSMPFNHFTNTFHFWLAPEKFTSLSEDGDSCGHRGPYMESTSEGAIIDYINRWKGDRTIEFIELDPHIYYDFSERQHVYGDLISGDITIVFLKGMPLDIDSLYYTKLLDRLAKLKGVPASKIDTVPGFEKDIKSYFQGEAIRGEHRTDKWISIQKSKYPKRKIKRVKLDLTRPICLGWDDRFIYLLPSDCSEKSYILFDKLNFGNPPDVIRVYKVRISSTQEEVLGIDTEKNSR